MSGPARAAGTTHGLLWLGALVYTAFVIYGSLVPLEFQAQPWDAAVARFAAIPFLQLGIGSRADWVANLLLFIPLSFLWMGVLTAGAGPLRTGLVAAALIPVAAALSVGIEFTQLYFPQRTVSQNDIFAETLGGLIGVLAWVVAGRRFLDWLQGWQQTHARAALAERMAWLYLAGVLIYNVLPLDLTISLVEIYHQWRDGKLNLVPFSRLPDDTAYAIYEISTDALLWVPLALLWRIDGTRNSLRAWGMTLGMAALLEFLQLFVYSRVSDVTDLFTAAAGAALGVWAGGRLARRAAPEGAPLPWAAWLPFALASGWVAVLMFVFWYPFDFQTDGAFIKSRLDFVQRVPFEVYYFGTEFRAITEVLRKTLFFAPLGALLAWGVARQPWRWRGPLFALSMVLLAAMPMLVELGQVMLPHKVADLTDWVLAWGGGLVGYALARQMVRAPRKLPARPVPAEVRHPHAPVPSTVKVRAHLPIMVGSLALALWGASLLPFMPYNVREMLAPETRAFSALMLALACYGLAVWPVWLARRPASGRARLWQLPLGMVVYGGVSFLLLRAAVPQESLHDLVGSPVLGWRGDWETGLRWMALTAVPGTLLYLAAQTVRRGRGRRLDALHFWAALPVLALAYWGVVAQAATDNLTELLASPPWLAFAVLCAGFYVVGLASALLASPGRRWQTALFACVASLPLAAGLLHLGLADDIDKYGQQFSALQFLLSRDRAHYAAPQEIWLRYSVLHVLVMAALASLQWPHFRTVRRASRPAAHASD